MALRVTGKARYWERSDALSNLVMTRELVHSGLIWPQTAPKKNPGKLQRPSIVLNKSQPPWYLFLSEFECCHVVTGGHKPILIHNTATSSWKTNLRAQRVFSMSTNTPWIFLATWKLWVGCEARRCITSLSLIDWYLFLNTFLLSGALVF
jgi:hypothetical protein